MDRKRKSREEAANENINTIVWNALKEMFWQI